MNAIDNIPSNEPLSMLLANETSLREDNACIVDGMLPTKLFQLKSKTSRPRREVKARKQQLRIRGLGNTYVVR